MLKKNYLEIVENDPELLRLVRIADQHESDSKDDDIVGTVDNLCEKMQRIEFKNPETNSPSGYRTAWTLASKLVEGIAIHLQTQTKICLDETKFLLEKTEKTKTPLYTIERRQATKRKAEYTFHAITDTTEATNRRVVHEEIEEVKTINLFDLSFQSLEQNIENVDKILEDDPFLVSADKITLREYDDIYSGHTGNESTRSEIVMDEFDNDNFFHESETDNVSPIFTMEERHGMQENILCLPASDDSEQKTNIMMAEREGQVSFVFDRLGLDVEINNIAPQFNDLVDQPMINNNDKTNENLIDLLKTTIPPLPAIWPNPKQIYRRRKGHTVLMDSLSEKKVANSTMKKRTADKSISCKKRKDIIAIKRKLSAQQYFGTSVLNGSCVFKQFERNAKTIQTDIDWTIVQSMFNLNDLNVPANNSDNKNNDDIDIGNVVQTVQTVQIDDSITSKTGITSLNGLNENSLESKILKKLIGLWKHEVYPINVDSLLPKKCHRIQAAKSFNSLLVLGKSRLIQIEMGDNRDIIHIGTGENLN